MVLNAAVQMLREADELKEKILKFKSGTSMLQEQSVWTTQQQLQKIYQKVLVLDLDYALEKKVEQDLWNVGFKQQIEALQAISKDRKNPLRSEAQAMLSWVLQAAAGFYLCLLHQICTTFKLDLPFRRRASLLGLVEGWGAGRGASAPAAAARYVTQHCLVHLGDLARYRHQLRVAHTFYRHAVCVSVHCGQPYNQLALVAWRRGRRLAALYWHVRSLAVRAPFPPAPANLRRTLTMHSQTSETPPVLPGVTPAGGTARTVPPAPAKLDAHAFVTEFIRAVNFIHSVEELETAEALVNTLNSSFLALVATDSFEPMTLIKMSCVIIWLLHAATDNLTLEAGALAEDERAAATLAARLAGHCLLALLLCLYTRGPAARATAAVKVWLEWLVLHGAARSLVLGARAALAAALAAALSAHRRLNCAALAQYDSVPLPEDEELHGFLPLEASFKRLKFASHASWDTYGGKLPQMDETEDPMPDISTTSFCNEPELEKKIRMHRIVQLGKKIADLHPERMTYTEEDDNLKFTATPIGEDQLSVSLAELQLSADLTPAEPEVDEEGETDDELAPPPPRPPLVISEADFREKVIEKRVGILKPQGSLERSREERALANSQDDQELETSENEGKEDKKESKKSRVNIAMAAIMRKQEETNKQVKFVTPPLTPEVPDVSPVKDTDKPKIIQPKFMKSLANLPVGRKTGGILSLKDKSAGYPHLVNTEPEPVKKTEKDEKKELKSNPGTSQNSQQNYQQKRQDVAPNNTWNPNIAPQVFSEGSRMNFHKNYGIQNAGSGFNPNFQPPPTSQGIRLPVVNPKEIDVRTAALQKQNSRQEMFQEGHKFAGHSYPISSDKKNFLNDLPPRFANQYRHWQTQDNHFNDNKFKDDNLKTNSMFNNQQIQRNNWLNTPVQETYQQSPMSWWKPENAQNFNNNFSNLNMQSNFYSPVMNSNMSSPYQNISFNQMPTSMGQSKPENVITPPTYLQPGMGQPVQAMQNLVNPGFNTSLGGFGSYPQTVAYDAAMYPQFGNNLGYQLMMDKQGYQAKDPMEINSLGFRNPGLDSQQRSFGDTLSDLGTPKDQNSGGEAATSGAGGSYSLFSGAAGPPAWHTPHTQPHQSLWSGPGPSPLERLLEQQKQMKQPPAPQ